MAPRVNGATFDISLDDENSFVLDRKVSFTDGTQISLVVKIPDAAEKTIDAIHIEAVKHAIALLQSTIGQTPSSE